jgi:hypothetical protein
MRKKPQTVAGLAELNRTRLSPNFFLRDFLYSDIAAIHGLSNIPDDPNLAIAAGSRLCNDLLEPLQKRFGRIAIRSAYRSAEVNALGNLLGDNCARNEVDAAAHIWDLRDTAGCMGAMATIIIPEVWDRFSGQGDWQPLAWWIHDHLSYSELQFFPKYFAFNIAWHQKPKRRIFSWVKPRGVLTKPGMANHDSSHESEWRRLVQSPAFRGRSGR